MPLANQVIPSVVNGRNGGGNSNHEMMLQIANIMVDLAHSIPEQEIIRGESPVVIWFDRAYFETRDLSRRLQNLKELFTKLQSKRISLEIG